MNAVAAPDGLSLAPGTVSLSELLPGATGTVVRVGARSVQSSALERRLVELGFVHGEHIEVLTQAQPGGDPFVVRVGTTTFALRRREVETVWVETGSSPAIP